jgi:hypothetical protein
MLIRLCIETPSISAETKSETVYFLLITLEAKWKWWFKFKLVIIKVWQGNA